jgi:hypothetical protein
MGVRLILRDEASDPFREFSGERQSEVKKFGDDCRPAKLELTLMLISGYPAGNWRKRGLSEVGADRKNLGN